MLQGFVSAIIFVAVIIFTVFVVTCVFCWIMQIYQNRKTINAILDYLGHNFPEGESMNKLTKKRETEEDD